VAEGDGPAWEDMVLIGRVARPHGLKGHVFVNPETDFLEERFAPGSRMWTRRAGGVEPLTVAAARIQGGRPVVGFEGYERIEDVEPFAGCELRIPESELQPLAPGQYYEHQLSGCLVETVGGGRVGTVLKVEGGLAGSCLVVSGDRGEVLIPFVAAICPEVDVEAKRIRIDPPDGLLELNAK
jgi:16S rRNA processing protein RimM